MIKQCKVRFALLNLALWYKKNVFYIVVSDVSYKEKGEDRFIVKFKSSFTNVYKCHQLLQKASSMLTDFMY